MATSLQAPAGFFFSDGKLEAVICEGQKFPAGFSGGARSGVLGAKPQLTTLF